MLAEPGDSVLFHGKVEKIGADGSSLPRGVFVTPSSLLVSLPAGGVTRTVQLSNVLELVLTMPEGSSDRFLCMIRVRNEALLTLSFTSREDADRFSDAIRRAASHVSVVHSSEEAVQERHVTLDAPRPTTKGVRFADPPASLGGSGHRLSPQQSSLGPVSHSSSSSHTAAAPVEPLEAAGAWSPADVNINSRWDRTGLFDAPSESHVTPFRRESTHRNPDEYKTSPRVGTLDRAREASMYQSDVTRPLQLQQSVAAGSYTSQQLEQRGQQVEPLGGVRAKRDAAASVQQRLLTDLELREQTVRRLQGELEEKNAFIDDLKSALRSQEGVFQEMLKATEQLRLVEGVKNQMEKQVVLLRAEVKHMEDRIKQQETEHSGELATKLAELHEAHTKEVEAVQEAFAQYDADMTEYVENLRKDRDREVHKWSEQERLLQKQIESQKREIAELTNALASRGGSPSLGKAATRNDKTLKSRVLLSPSQQKGGKARQVCPSASELELQMLSLEEEHERSRLYAKLRQYARSQRRTPNRVPFDGKDDNIKKEEGEESEEEQANGLVTSAISSKPSAPHLHTPRAGAAAFDEVPSLASTPGMSRGIRNRAIL